MTDWKSCELPEGYGNYSGMLRRLEHPEFPGLPGHPERALTDDEYVLCFMRGLAKLHGAAKLISALEYIQGSA